MKAAMKVVNDSLSKYPNGLPKQMKNASNIIQQEWFKVMNLFFEFIYAKLKLHAKLIKILYFFF